MARVNRKRVVGGSATMRPRSPWEEALKTQPAQIRKELEDIEKHEALVLRALREDANRQAFLKDPAGFLESLGITLSPVLRQKMRTATTPLGLGRPLAFRLSNGQVVRPKVTITFTGGRKEP